MNSVIGNSSSHPCPCDQYKNCTLTNESANACCVPETSVEPENKFTDNSGDKEIDERESHDDKTNNILDKFFGDKEIDERESSKEPRDKTLDSISSCIGDLKNDFKNLSDLHHRLDELKHFSLVRKPGN